MKVIENTIEIERWDDPGDYPNAVAAGPLQSHWQWFGEVVIELEDELEDWDITDLLEELEIPSKPYGCSLDWDCKQEGNRIIANIKDIEED